MESILDGLKLWGPFAGFCVAFFGFGWRALNRREDKLDARFRESINLLREDTRQRDYKHEARIEESINLLRDDMQQRQDQLEVRIDKKQDGLEVRIKESINQLRDETRQINVRLDANSQAFHADISTLTEKIEANAHDLRVEFRQLNQSFVNHLEHHEESRQQPE